PAREHRAGAGGAARHRAHQDHRRAEARGPAGPGAEDRTDCNQAEARCALEVQELGESKMPKRTLHGVVVSDKQDKTVVVRVRRRFTHPTMKKTIRRSKKYHAHDEANTYAVGDMVWIEERRPISKLKCWEVV